MLCGFFTVMSALLQMVLCRHLGLGKETALLVFGFGQRDLNRLLKQSCQFVMASSSVPFITKTCILYLLDENGNVRAERS